MHRRVRPGQSEPLDQPKPASRPRFADLQTRWESGENKRERQFLARSRARPRHGRWPMSGKIKPPGPADQLLAHLEWVQLYAADPAFGAAWIALFETGLVVRCLGEDGAKDVVRWRAGLEPLAWIPVGRDPYEAAARGVAAMVKRTGWSERLASAWWVATHNLDAATFDSAVKRLTDELRAMRER